MNISFLNKAALVILLVVTCMVAFWRYEVTVVQPHQNALLTSFRNDLSDRDRLKDILQDLGNVKIGVEQIAAQAKLEEGIVAPLRDSLSAVAGSDARLLAGTQASLKQFEIDITEFLKITNQIALYENKTKEFIDGFAVYFHSFENDMARWKEDAAGAIMNVGEVPNTIPVAGMIQKIATLEKIIPELGAFEQKLQANQASLDRWIKAMNDAASIEEKQAIFGQGQYILKSFPDLFGTFNGYVLKTLEREQANIRKIANQMDGAISVIQQPLQEKFGSLNNAIETKIIQSKIKERQYRDLKRVNVMGTVVVLFGLFFGIVAFTFRFKRAITLLKNQTSKAAADSKELVSSLDEHAGLLIKNFELSRNFKDGLEETVNGFTGRQLNLGHIDQLVRDTDLLVKESRENFLTIKEEFYNTEKVSQEIVQLTGALDGVAHQMTVIAERAGLNAVNNSQQADGKQDTIDELKYLSSRIRHAVISTHDALETRKDKINEAKVKFDLIEKNMDQMTENTRQALKEIALARLDHSQEVSRINEILENAKTKSLQIADEINGLNRQVRDFSVLSKHLDALHELAVKAASLNAQSLLVEAKDPEVIPALENSSQRMNDFIKEYFTKVFESDVLKPAVKDDSVDGGPIEISSQEPASRIKETIKSL